MIRIYCSILGSILGSPYFWKLPAGFDGVVEGSQGGRGLNQRSIAKSTGMAKTECFGTWPFVTGVLVCTQDSRLIGHPQCDSFQKLREPNIDPIYCNPYYGDPKMVPPNFRKSPCCPRSYLIRPPNTLTRGFGFRVWLWGLGIGLA